MSTDIQLDRNRIAELEPSEGDEREQMMLSPFAVPRGLVFNLEPSGLLWIRLEYSGKASGASPEPLDESTEPQVTILISHQGQKVVELRFKPAARPIDLIRIADRLERKATQLTNAAKRLSYRMTGQILRNFLAPLLPTLPVS